MSLKLNANRTRFAVALGLMAGLASLASAPAFAGECPADKVMKGAMTSGETMPKDVTDDVLAAIDLSQQRRRLHRNDAAHAQAGRSAGRCRAVARAQRTCRQHIHPVRLDHRIPQQLQGADRTRWPATLPPNSATLRTGGRTMAAKPAVLISADLLPAAMADDQSM